MRFVPRPALLSGCLRSSRLVRDSRSASGGFSVEVDVAELWPSVVNRFHACSKVWLCCFPTCKNVSSVAHHVEVNPLPAQLRALGRDGLRSLESSRRVDGAPFVFHNLREDLVLADASICFLPALLLDTALLCQGILLLAQSWRNCAFVLVPFVDWYAFSCSGVIFRSMAACSFERVLIPASALCFSAHSFLSSARLSFCDSACSVYFFTVSCHSAIISGKPCGSFVNRSWCVASSPQVEAACSFATNDTLLCAFDREQHSKQL